MLVYVDFQCCQQNIFKSSAEVINSDSDLFMWCISLFSPPAQDDHKLNLDELSRKYGTDVNRVSILLVHVVFDRVCVCVSEPCQHDSNLAGVIILVVDGSVTEADKCTIQGESKYKQLTLKYLGVLSYYTVFMFTITQACLLFCMLFTAQAFKSCLLRMCCCYFSGVSTHDS